MIKWFTFQGFTFGYLVPFWCLMGALCYGMISPQPTCDKCVKLEHRIHTMCWYNTILNHFANEELCRYVVPHCCVLRMSYVLQQGQGPQL